MTKDEFISKAETWRRIQKRNQVVFLVCAGSLFGAWCFLFSRYDTSAPDSSLRIAWACAPFLLFFVMIFGNHLVIRYTFTHHGISCPACGKPLGGVEAIVIATGNCGSCGQHILEGAASPSDVA